METYMGTILPVLFPFAPDGWALCDGTLLNVNQYEALFSLLGTTFGGDGHTTFGLPDLRGRTVVGSHTTPIGNWPPLKLGQTTGAYSIALAPQGVAAGTITVGNLPPLTIDGKVNGASLTVKSTLYATTSGPGTAAPVAGAMLSASGSGTSSGAIYYLNPTPPTPLPAVPLGGASVSTAVGSGTISFETAPIGAGVPLAVPFQMSNVGMEVMQPYCGVYYIICVIGLYPQPAS